MGHPHCMRSTALRLTHISVPSALGCGASLELLKITSNQYTGTLNHTFVMTVQLFLLTQLCLGTMLVIDHFPKREWLMKTGLGGMDASISANTVKKYFLSQEM